MLYHTKTKPQQRLCLIQDMAIKYVQSLFLCHSSHHGYWFNPVINGLYQNNYLLRLEK